MSSVRALLDLDTTLRELVDCGAFAPEQIVELWPTWVQDEFRAWDDPTFEQGEWEAVARDAIGRKRERESSWDGTPQNDALARAGGRLEQQGVLFLGCAGVERPDVDFEAQRRWRQTAPTFLQSLGPQPRRPRPSGWVGWPADDATTASGGGGLHISFASFERGPSEERLTARLG